MENLDEHLVPKNVEQMGAECLARMQALFIQKPYCPVAVYGYKDNLHEYFWFFFIIKMLNPNSWNLREH